MKQGRPASTTAAEHTAIVVVRGVDLRESRHRRRLGCWRRLQASCAHCCLVLSLVLPPSSFSWPLVRSPAGAFSMREPADATVRSLLVLLPPELLRGLLQCCWFCGVFFFAVLLDFIFSQMQQMLGLMGLKEGWKNEAGERTRWRAIYRECVCVLFVFYYCYYGLLGCLPGSQWLLCFIIGQGIDAARQHVLRGYISIVMRKQRPWSRASVRHRQWPPFDTDWWNALQPCDTRVCVLLEYGYFSTKRIKTTVGWLPGKVSFTWWSHHRTRGEGNKRDIVYE